MHTRRAVIYLTSLATHHALHGLCDHVVQNPADAAVKREPGGEWACVRHVASYHGAQYAALAVACRVLGVRLPWRAAAAGLLLNAVTHYHLDRGPLLRTLSRWTGKTGYIEHCRAVRPGGVVQETGPGTAWLELDKAWHLGIGAASALLTAWLADR